MQKNEKKRMIMAGAVVLMMVMWVVVLYGAVAESEEEATLSALALHQNALLYETQNEEWADMEVEVGRMEVELVVMDTRLWDKERDLAACRSTRTEQEQEVMALYGEIRDLHAEMDILDAALDAERSRRETEMGVFVGDLGTVVVKGRIYLAKYIPAKEVLPLDDMESLIYSVDRLLYRYQLRIESLEGE